MSWLKEKFDQIFTPWAYVSDQTLKQKEAQTELAKAQADLLAQQNALKNTTKSSDNTLYIILAVVVIAVVAMAIYFKTKGK